jgi:hypothetical protein
MSGWIIKQKSFMNNLNEAMTSSIHSKENIGQLTKVKKSEKY